MTDNAVLARQYTFEVDQSGSAASGDWVDLRASMRDQKPKEDVKNADTTTYSDEGWDSHIPASRSGSITIGGVVIIDPDDGTLEAQQVLQTWSNQMGAEGLWKFRVTDQVANESKTYWASCSYTTGSGSNDDESTWEAEITRSGQVTSSALPTVPEAPTAVSGTDTQASATTVDWTNGAGSPTSYQVEIDDQTASVTISHTGDTKPMLISGMTDGHTVRARVRARNAGGWSDWSGWTATYVIND